MEKQKSYDAVWAADNEWKRLPSPPKPLTPIPYKEALNPARPLTVRASLTGIQVAVIYGSITAMIDMGFVALSADRSGDYYWLNLGIDMSFAWLILSVWLVWKCARFPKAKLTPDFNGIKQILHTNKVLVALALTISFVGLLVSQFQKIYFGDGIAWLLFFAVTADIYAPNVPLKENQANSGQK